MLDPIKCTFTQQLNIYIFNEEVDLSKCNYFELTADTLRTTTKIIQFIPGCDSSLHFFELLSRLYRRIRFYLYLRPVYKQS